MPAPAYSLHPALSTSAFCAGNAVLQQQLSFSRVLADSTGSLVQPMQLRNPTQPLGVCIMTADFWGLSSAGGTATAYHLLAHVRACSLPA